MKLKAIRYADIERYPAYFRLSQTLKEDFFGSAPAPFIGRYGYPKVNVGLLAPQETSAEAWLHDAPRTWAARNFSIPRVTDLRLSLVNSRAQAHIKASEKIVELAQQVGLAATPVDIEVHLKKKPALGPLTDRIITPMGPSAPLRNIRITSTPKIPAKVQKAHDDTDLKAADAVQELYRSEYDENTLSRILSVGAIGIGKNRKLVPTRWSITAVDDTLGKGLAEKVRQHPGAEHQAWFGSFFGNHFLILCFTDAWSYELFELYMPRGGIRPDAEVRYTTDYEPYAGRTGYAENCAGGYYAARLPILEQLNERRQQASVLALRFITDEYTTPLGVWVVREAVRKAVTRKPLAFASKELLLRYATDVIRIRFNFDLARILGQSRILRNQKQQRRLHEF